jgi:hypothetical protein
MIWVTNLTWVLSSQVCVRHVGVCCLFMLCPEHGVFMLPLLVVRITTDESTIVSVWESSRTSRDSCEDQVVVR